LSWRVLCSDPDVRYFADGREGRFFSTELVIF
jgi:hypothetical protein